MDTLADAQALARQIWSPLDAGWAQGDGADHADGQPLGLAVGSTLGCEAIAAARRGLTDFQELVEAVAGRCCSSLARRRPGWLRDLVSDVIADGRLRPLPRLRGEPGRRPALVDHPDRLPAAGGRPDTRAGQRFCAALDAREGLGWFTVELGGGRQKGDPSTW